MCICGAMKIGSGATVKLFHSTWRTVQHRRLTSSICGFHLGFNLGDTGTVANRNTDKARGPAQAGLFFWPGQPSGTRRGRAEKRTDARFHRRVCRQHKKHNGEIAFRGPCERGLERLNTIVENALPTKEIEAQDMSTCSKMPSRTLTRRENPPTWRNYYRRPC